MKNIYSQIKNDKREQEIRTEDSSLDKIFICKIMKNTFLNPKI